MRDVLISNQEAMEAASFKVCKSSSGARRILTLLGNSPICPVTKRRKSRLRHKFRPHCHKPAEG